MSLGSGAQSKGLQGQIHVRGQCLNANGSAAAAAKSLWGSRGDYMLPSGSVGLTTELRLGLYGVPAELATRHHSQQARTSNGRWTYRARAGRVDGSGQIMDAGPTPERVKRRLGHLHRILCPRLMPGGTLGSESSWRWVRFPRLPDEGQRQRG